MPLIDLETAVDHILRACNARHKKGHSPFFFLVGGGISSRSIPLASEIVEHCKTKAAKECTRTTEPKGKQLIDIYSHWFDQAYPQPSDRQEYLRELIEGKPVSHANLYLAHLLLEKTITNLVVTPNFDDFLSRALTLFGTPHIVCDHPGTAGRIHPDQDDIQIIHVHGTYWFYDCCNLLGEIKERSQSSTQTTLTMASLLERILWERSPLVIGYGGWEGDVIMTAFKRRLQSPLGHNIYWFCYRRADVDSLPDWLKSNPQVYFVVLFPQEPNRQAVDGLSERETEVIGLSTRLGIGVVGEVREIETRAKRQIKPSPTAEAKDIYTKAISNLKIESQLEGMRDAMRRSQYREAVKLAVEIYKNTLNEAQLRELMNAMWSASLELRDDSDFEEELKGCDLVIAVGDMLLKENKDEPSCTSGWQWRKSTRVLYLASSIDGRRQLLFVMR